MPGRPKDITNQRFGRLVALHRAGKDRHNRFYWECACDCGNVAEVLLQALTSGDTKSCGCITRERPPGTKHGHAINGKWSPTYYSWMAMKQRCLNPNHAEYSRYGAKGVTVCDRWKDSFETFLADMGERPAGKTIDRFPNKTGNYEPGNCRWATPEEQSQNRTTAKFTLEKVKGIRALRMREKRTQTSPNCTKYTPSLPEVQLLVLHGPTFPKLSVFRI